MKERIFYLRQKDYDVGILIIDDECEIREAQIQNPDRVPFSKTNDNRQIIKWWNERAIPEGREHLTELLQKHGCSGSHELLLKNLGLSLTDTYWLCPYDYKDMRFDDINLFDNGSDKIGFHEGEGRVHYSGSPDASLGGFLAKTAVHHNNEWYLEKHFNSKYPDAQQNVNELFATKLHELQGWKEYTSYYSSSDTVGICETSKCKYFTSKSAELVSAFDLTRDSHNNEADGKKNLEDYIKKCIQGGLDEAYVRHSLDYMILMDFIITNTDRHWRNFGVLRNPESLKLISIAPIFDNGNSMFFDEPYIMSRLSLTRLESVGIEKSELKRLELIGDKTVVRSDLLPSPSEVKAFYAEHGIREDRAGQIAASYSNKLDLFMEYQHGITISVAKEIEGYVNGPAYIDQQPNPDYTQKRIAPSE